MVVRHLAFWSYVGTVCPADSESPDSGGGDVYYKIKSSPSVDAQGEVMLFSAYPLEQRSHATGVSTRSAVACAATG